MIALADLKPWLGIAPADGTKDDLLTVLEAGAVAFVEQQTGQYFGAVAELNAVVLGDGGPKLYLPFLAAAPPASVDERPYPGAEATTVAAEADDGFELRGTSTVAWLHRLGGGGWAPRYEYSVTYNRGYTAGEEPADIRELVINLVRFRYAELEREPGVVSETFGNYSYSRGATYQAPEAFLNQVPGARETLERWRRGPFV